MIRNTLLFPILFLFIKPGYSQIFPIDGFKISFGNEFKLTNDAGVNSYKSRSEIYKAICRVNVFYLGENSMTTNFQDTYFDDYRKMCIKNSYEYLEIQFKGKRAFTFLLPNEYGTKTKQLIFIANKRSYTIMYTTINVSAEEGWNSFIKSFELL